MVTIILVSTFVCIAGGVMAVYWLVFRPVSATAQRLSDLDEARAGVVAQSIEPNPMESLAARLAEPINKLVPASASDAKKLQRELMQAGYRSSSAPAIYRVTQLFSMLFFPLLIVFVWTTMAYSLSDALLPALFALGAGFLLPRFWIAGGEPPRIAVLRPTEEGSTGVTVVGSAPLPVSSARGSVHRVEDLHLPVQQGDSVGFLFRAGEVDLGVRMRAQPDGAIQSFSLPCEPCGMDGGTGVELLFDALVEPDVDEDGLGDESQDPDGGGLGLDWEEDWFEDFEEGDELDEDLDEDASRRERRQIRLLDADRRRRRPCVAAAPCAEGGARERRRHAARETPHRRRAVQDDPDRRHARQARRARAAAPGCDARGARVLERRRRVRTKVVVAYFPRRGPLTLLMRSARL